MMITAARLFELLGEPDYKLPRMRHDAEPFHYWSRESIEAAMAKIEEEVERGERQ